MAEHVRLPLVVRSFLGHLDLQAKHQPDRSLTGEQVATFNWLLGQAKDRYAERAVQSLSPIEHPEGLTVAHLLVRVRTLADVMRV